jgi:hypothetical protein
MDGRTLPMSGRQQKQDVDRNGRGQDKKQKGSQPCRVDFYAISFSLGIGSIDCRWFTDSQIHALCSFPGSLRHLCCEKERTESKQSLLVSTCLLRANVCAPRCSSSENTHCSSAVALSKQQQQQKLAYHTPEPKSCGVMLLEIDPIGSSAIGRTARPHEKLGRNSGNRQVSEGGFPWRGGEG